MPKTNPLTQAQRDAERWKRADDNFRGQIGALLAVSRLKKSELAGLLDISQSTMRTRWNHPDTLIKSEERRLIGIFARYGLMYDPLLGERNEVRTA